MSVLCPNYGRKCIIDNWSVVVFLSSGTGGEGLVFWVVQFKSWISLQFQILFTADLTTITVKSFAIEVSFLSYFSFQSLHWLIEKKASGKLHASYPSALNSQSNLCLHVSYSKPFPSGSGEAVSTDNMLHTAMDLWPAQRSMYCFISLTL